MTPIRFRATSLNPITFPIPTRTSFSSCQFPRFSTQSATWRSVAPLRAVKQQPERSKAAGPAKDRRKKEKDKKKAGGRRRFRDVEEEEEDDDDDDDDVAPAPLPKAPAGFVVDAAGKVLMVSSKRLISIVDPINNAPLECVIRRVFKSTQGHDCMLLCPVDMPVLILRSSNFSGWTTISDEETETVLPSAAYALAKSICILGNFCYGEEDIFEFNTGNRTARMREKERNIRDVVLTASSVNSSFWTKSSLIRRRDDDVALDGMSNEGVEVTSFDLDGAHYMIYTPCDPVLFVAVKDNNGELKVADDDLMDDPAVLGAVSEESEFNAMVEEEIELRESVMGERE